MERVKEGGTIYVAHWTHPPENCPGRTKEGAKMLSDFWANRDAAAKKGIKLLGAYATVTEHDYYIILQAKDYASVVEFFLPLIPTQTGSFRPVLPMEEWIKMNQPKWEPSHKSKSPQRGALEPFSTSVLKTADL